MESDPRVLRDPPSRLKAQDVGAQDRDEPETRISGESEKGRSAWTRCPSKWAPPRSGWSRDESVKSLGIDVAATDDQSYPFPRQSIR